ncbi:hypothetical protein [Luteolibacter soli]|uniref:Uncharacterized protein n=1 Tax=Luteolibacter soli TaxID=3135280 RepID=A0ABU9AVC3_9BACT
MFVSPLSRILMVLTLLAFAGAFSFVEEPGGTFRNTLTGASLTLWAVTIARLVTEGSACDDRGFHRTRPRGERMALRRINCILAGMVVAIASIAAVRGWIYHLGWPSALWAAAITLVPVASFTMAMAAGTGILIQRKTSVRRVILILLAGPIGLALVTMVVPYTARWISSIVSDYRMGMGFEWRSMPAWMSAPTWASALGVAGYGVAWWLASRQRRGRTAILLAGLTGILIQLRVTKAPLEPETSLPVSAVKIERLPAPPPSKSLSESMMPRFRDDWGMRDPQILSSLRATNLGENEHIDFNLLIDPQEHSSQRYQSPSGGLGRDHDAFLLKDSENLWLRSDLDALMDDLARRLPGYPKLEYRNGQDSISQRESISNKADQAQLTTAPWTIDGVMFQLDDLGSFPVLAHSSSRLNGGGMVKTWDLRLSHYETSLGFRVIQPDPPSVPAPDQMLFDGMYARPAANMIWAIMVNESSTKALMVLDGRNFQMGRQRAFGSHWSDFWLNLRYSGNPQKWTEEEVLRSKIHLFVSRPVAKVHASLPPP